MNRAHYKFWPKRLPRSITPPATSLWHNLAVNALRFPAKPALVFFDQVMSYAQLMQQAESLAGTLAACGVKSGDRVGLYLQNSPQWVVAHFAILRANAVVVPVNPMNRAEELKHYITDPGTRVFIAAADLAHDLVRADAGLDAGERLSHLIVTHYRDAFDVDASLARLAGYAPPFARAGQRRCHRLERRAEGRRADSAPAHRQAR
jgi:fatty-acyl-CoA synthase